MQSALQNWQSRGRNQKTGLADEHLLEANRNIRELLEDTSIPSPVREELSAEFDEIESISEKLRRGEIHVAAFGRVGVGKSSLLNALLGHEAFSTSPLHGETRDEERADWQSLQEGHLVLIDTPGIDELDGTERELLARKVSKRVDIILMVCDGDLTATEFEALQELTRSGRTVLLVLNKADRYRQHDLSLLTGRLAERCHALLTADRIITVSAQPKPQVVIQVHDDGTETESLRSRPPDISNLKHRLWEILEKDGKSLAALNAALFATELDEKIATRIVEARRTVAEKIIRKYCLAKGILVAVNPVPVADLLAAAGTDVTMVLHLGEVYGFRMTRREASKLLLTISAQLLALMGAYWGVNLVSSALKTVSAGLSTAITASAQGALAWYATYLTGKMAESWFSKGKSWGQAGPRETARDILATLDRDSVIQSARADILARLKGATQ